MPHIVLLGTCDTKLQEILYLHARLLSNGASQVTLVDVGRKPVSHEAITVSQTTLTHNYAPDERKDVSTLARGEVVKYMIGCASKWLRETHQAGLKDSSRAIHGILSAGGTGGTSLASAVMRESLPIGFPKLIISTAASGDTSPIVAESDVTLMYSVVDISGSNSLLRTIMGNAAGAIVGMAKSYTPSLSPAPSSQKDKKRVAITMFGVTTPCVDFIRSYLESLCPIECFIFHCTGSGGKAMERLIAAGEIDAVIDLTTTEIADEIAGGVMSAGPKRMEEGLRRGIPYIISLGATDMVNFGPKSTVPERYANRKLFEHNPTVTLMRTSAEECRAIGGFIAAKISKFAKNKEMVEVVLPLGGVSMISTPRGPFADTEADEACFKALKKGLEGREVKVVEDERAINQEEFAIDVAKRLIELMGL